MLHDFQRFIPVPGVHVGRRRALHAAGLSHRHLCAGLHLGGGRHFYSRHRGLWYSTVEVHEAATRVTDSMLSQALPAGSGGLAIDHIVRARPGYQATD